MRERRSLGLNAWMLIIIGIAYSLVAVAVVVGVRTELRAHALDEAAGEATIITDRSLALHTYFSEELKPAVFELSEQVAGPDYFDASWMSSSYVVYRIQEIFAGDLGGSKYYYHEASINARNPEREADALEAEFIERLEADPGLTEDRNVRELAGEPYFVVMRRGERFEATCMRCHGVPEDAPADLVSAYGDTRGFGKTVGEASIISVRIPLAEAYAHVDDTTRNLSLLLLGIMAASFGGVYGFNRSWIVRPIHEVRDAAVAIAEGTAEPGQTLEVRGPREIEDLGGAFSTMSVRVADTIDTLEDRVARRTQTLDAMNQELLAEITEREGIEHQLVAEKAYAENLIETANVMVVGLDSKGTVTVFNKGAEAVTGYSAAEIIGTMWFDTICPSAQFPQIAREWCARYDIEDPAFKPVAGREREGRVLTKDGRERVIQWRESSVMEDGLHTGVIAFGIDVTESEAQRHELERYKSGLEVLVEERTRQLEDVNEDLRRATAAKSQFLANMSHELRTPLNSVIGFSDVLLRGMAGSLNDEQERQLAMVNDAGRYLLALVNDVLDISRVENGAVSVDVSEFDVSALARGVADSLAPSIQARRLELVLDCPDEPLIMRSDETKVRQILTNIVMNAIKFTSSGGVTIVCSAKNGEVELVVRDTGEGISADELGAVFTVFWQHKVGDRAKPEGAGLGLAIARRLAHILGGGITASSEIGVGSTFTVTLPRDIPEYRPRDDADEVLA